MLNIVLVCLSSMVQTVVHPICLKLSYPVKIKLCQHAVESNQTQLQKKKKKRQSKLECHLDNLTDAKCERFNNELYFFHRDFKDCLSKNSNRIIMKNCRVG